jgi:hypothetical protein
MKEIIQKSLFIVICSLFTLMSFMNIFLLNDFFILINVINIVLFSIIISINFYELIIIIKVDKYVKRTN